MATPIEKKVVQANKLEAPHIEHKKKLFSIGLTEQMSIDVVSGSEFKSNGVKKMKWKFPTEGIMKENTCKVIIPGIVLTEGGANQSSLVKGQIDAAFNHAKVYSSTQIIHDMDYFGFLQTKKTKWAKKNQNVVAFSSLTGYNAASTDLEGTVYTYVAEFANDFFLSQRIPLFLLTEGTSLYLELTIDDEPNNFSITNTGTNPRVLTITAPQLVYRLVDSAELAQKYAIDGYAGTYSDYDGARNEIASAATSYVSKHTAASGRFSGAEFYLAHKSDVDSHTDHAKIWKDQINTLSAVDIKWQSHVVASNAALDKPAAQLYEMNLEYRGQDYDSYEPSITSWAQLDGDFCIAIPVGAIHPSKGVSGFKDQREFQVKLSFSGGTTEAMYIYSFHRTSHSYFVDPVTKSIKIDGTGFF